MEQKIWFTADTHIGHKNILKHCTERAKIGGFEVDDIETHDKWLIDRWNKTVSKNDVVYILGDFSFASSETLKKKILPKMHGQKFLILGNHDKSSENLDGYFKQITQIKEITFKQKNFGFLDEDFKVVMCHYPMLSWNGKTYGSVQCHGHCHDRLTQYNIESGELRVDVGWDSELSQFDLVSLEKLYEYMKGIAAKHDCKTLHEYAETKTIR